MSCAATPCKSCSFVQAKVDQTPKWDNQVVGRKHKIIRANKRRRRRKMW